MREVVHVEVVEFLLPIVNGEHAGAPWARQSGTGIDHSAGLDGGLLA